MRKFVLDFSPDCGIDFDYRRWCYGGGKGGGSAPAAPDPAATAAAQGQANKEAVRESAKVNQINQVGPYGNVTYTGDIGSPDRTQTTTLNPTAQAVLDGQQNVSRSLTDFAQEYVPRVAEGLETPFNTADVGQAPVANDAERQRIEDGLMDRLNPRFEKDEAALQTRLANQGIGVGSEAYSDAYDDFNQAKTDARLSVIDRAGSEYARDYGLKQSAYNQNLSDALLNRTQGLNEVSALVQGAPALQSPPNVSPAQYQIAPGDFQGAAALKYQGDLNAYNQRVGGAQSSMGGLFGLGSALGSSAITKWSDRRVKTDIKRVGVTDNGLPVYTYRYQWGGPVEMGVMAQDVVEVAPEAVHSIDGVLAVDYGAIR